MKKALIILMILTSVFSASWVLKDKTPRYRPDELAANQEVAWWNLAPNQVPTVADDWKIDPEIPDNYIPVPGEDELYMVIDENGNIKEYRHRTKQSDGSWVWETVNPDIPAGYIPVEGLENVYKVIDENGNVTYVKYIRNDDDTFTFVPCDSKGNIIDVKAKEDENGIPANYVRIKDNIFAVYDENGVLIGYKERIQNADGTYSWVDCNAPAESTEQVGNGGQGSGSNGNNGGGNGNFGGNGGSGNNGGGYSGNSGIPQDPGTSGNNNGGTTIIIQQNPTGQTSQPSGGNGGSQSPVTVQPDPNTSSTPRKQGENYTTEDRYITTDTSGGWKITYETIVYKTYSSDGVLLSTKKIGPTEISKERLGEADLKAPDKTRIQSTLDAELTRVSSGIAFEDQIANDIISKINTERVAQGLPTLKTGGNASKVAKLLAADMATYDHSDYSSPMYGTITELIQRYNLTVSNPGHISLKTTQKSAQDLHSRLLAENYNVITNAGNVEVGVAVANRNGYYYVCEVFF